MKILKGSIILMVMMTTILLSGCELLEYISTTEQKTTTNSTTYSSYMGPLPTTTQRTTVGTTAVDPYLLLEATLDNMKNNVLNYQNKVEIYKHSGQGNTVTYFSYMFDMLPKTPEMDSFHNENRKFGTNLILMYDDQTNESQELYLELVDDKRTLYTDNNGTWQSQDVYQEILNEKYYGALVNLDYHYLANQDARLIGTDYFNQYEVSINGGDMLLSSLQMDLNDFLNTYQINQSEFHNIVNDTKLLITISREAKEIVSVEVDFTMIINDLLELARARVDFDIPTYVTYKINNQFGNVNEVDIEITNEMKVALPLFDHQTILSETYKNMMSAYNYENKMVLETLSSSGGSYLNGYYTIDMEDTTYGIIHHRSYYGGNYYLENNQTRYTYMEGEWGTYTLPIDEFNLSPSQLILNKEMYQFLNIESFNGLIEFNSNNNLITYTVKRDMSDFLMIANHMKRTDFIRLHNITEEELNELFENYTFDVTIDTTTNRITRIDLDFSTILRDVFLLNDESNFSETDFIKSRLTIWYGQYDEIELFITDDMRGME